MHLSLVLSLVSMKVKQKADVPMSCLCSPVDGASSLQTVSLSTALVYRQRAENGENEEGVCGVSEFWRPANHDEKPLQN